MAFALPSRDILLIADVREEHAVEALSLLTRPIHDNAAYAISFRVYRYARADERILLEPVEFRQTLRIVHPHDVFRTL